METQARGRSGMQSAGVFPLRKGHRLRSRLGSLLRPLLLLPLLLASTSSFGGAAKGADTDLARARAFIAGYESSPNHLRLARQLFDIDLSGYRYSQELTLGHGLRAISISGFDQGAIFIFSESGKLLAKKKTSLVISIEIVDLDGDGLSEIVTEEQEASGTGILGTSFSIYGIYSNRLLRVWHDLAYSHFYPPEGKSPQERIFGFVRPEVSSSTQGFIYVTFNAVTGAWTRKNFVFDKHGQVHELKN
jgi:hypothetical protein